MRVLISAYSCEPDKGSEPGVGWGWVKNMSRLHSIWVLTRKNNQKHIEQARGELGKDIHFCYVDLPKWMIFWKKGHFGVNLYYFLWQIYAWKAARSLVKKHSIEIAHHVTFMSITRFSFVSLLGIPSVVGPVGGLQQCPPCGWPFIRHPFREYLRTISIKTLRWNPMFRFGTGRATKIVLANSSGKEILSKSLLSKTVSPFQVAPNLNEEMGDDPKYPLASAQFIILWSGRLEDHKGFEILIRAINILKITRGSIIDNFRVIVTGKGPEKAFYSSLISHLNLNAYFEFKGWVSKEVYRTLLQSASVFVFTSLRETTGISLQEAMLAGLPVVVIANGGPLEMVSSHTGMHIAKDSKNPAEDLANALVNLYHDPLLRANMSKNSFIEARKELSWNTLSQRMTGIYQEVVYQY